MRLLALTLSLALSLVTAVQAADSPLDGLTRLATESKDPKLQLNLLKGMNAALKGKRNVPAPKGWADLYARLAAGDNAELKQQAQTLSVIFGGGEALADLRRALSDAAAPEAARKAALESLVSARDADSVAALLAHVKAPGPLRQASLRGLATFEQAEIPAAVLAAYPSLNSEERRDAVAALASRPASAQALLAAVEQGKLPRTDLSPPIARQLHDLKDARVDAWLTKNLGAVHTTSADKQKEIATRKAYLTPAVMEKGDAAHGRALFTQTCAVCHTLFAHGGKIGPELPGAFEDIDYLLQNIVDPNAIIGKDYQQTVVQTKNGQTIMGIVAAEDPSSVTLKTLAGPTIVQRSDVAQLSVLEVSLMPEGLLAALQPDDVRDLFSYLRLHGPVPMLASPANVNDFFNGTDFTNWSVSSASKWQVKNGEITGQGSADRPEFVTSDLTAANFRLKARVQIRGEGAWAELAVRGDMHDGGFTGLTLRLTSKAAAGTTGQAEMVRYEAGSPGKQVVVSTQWPADGLPVEIIAHGGTVNIRLPANTGANILGGAETDRTNFHLRVMGEKAQLKITGLTLQLE